MKGEKISMLEYCKLILEKLSFHKQLFRKEYKKSLKYYLSPNEHEEFKRWVREKFGGRLYNRALQTKRVPI